MFGCSELLYTKRQRDIPGIALYLAMLFVVTKLARLIGK